MFVTAKLTISRHHVEINDQRFLLGEIATDLLNMREQFAPLRDACNTFAPYIAVKEIPDTKTLQMLHDTLTKADDILMQHKLFRAIRDESVVILSDVKQLLDSDSFAQDIFPEHLQVDEGMSGEDQLAMLGSFLETVKEEEPSLFTILTPEKRWLTFRNHLRYYRDFINDIYAFNATISNFLSSSIVPLTKLSADSYARAYYEFFNSPIAYKAVVNPISSMGCGADYYKPSVTIMHCVPMQTEDGSYEIADYVEMGDVLAILKIDFLRAIQAGHVVRKCQHCGRCFLLTKHYNTLYCDGKSPVNPKYGCSQVAGQIKKEKSKNFPYNQTKNKRLSLLRKHLERELITTQEFEQVKKTLTQMHYHATTQATPYLDFGEQTDLDKLYKQLGICPQHKQRGRPKA
ncbi:MAG: DUF6076 domain-containing protein [Faecalibacterium sp.]